MSTKMSNDLNITRPSSRVIRPPGGGSSISFGSDPSPSIPENAAFKSSFGFAEGGTSVAKENDGGPHLARETKTASSFAFSDAGTVDSAAITSGRHIRGTSTFSVAEGSTETSNFHPQSRNIRGGGATFSFSDGSDKAAMPNTPAKKAAPFGAIHDSPFKPNASASAAAAPASVTAAPAAPVAAEKKSVAGKVGILIAGTLGAEELTHAISKALVLEGISGTVISCVSDTALVPFAAQKFVLSVDVVVVGSILMDPSHTEAPTLRTALSQIALSAGKPIIPGLVVQESLLEAKALLGMLAADWARAAAAALNMKHEALVVTEAPEVVIVAPVVVTAAVTDVHTLMTALKESLNSHGARGIAGIGRKFRIADDDNSGKIEYSEFTKVIGEHALGWAAAQVKAVFDHFDSDKSGSISFDEFIFGIRGQLNERRKQLVLLAFEILDADHSGLVELNDISAKYDASKHPDVIAGRRSKDDVLREFLDTFDSIDKDGKVTPVEFIKYYGNCSSSIDDDDYFELMIRNAWHISGGEGWCANSSCRRVLVGHQGGLCTVEEIKNDLGISGTDKAAMVQRLVEQGVADIEYIEGNDGAKFYPGGAPASATATASAARPATAPASVPNRHRKPVDTFSFG